MQTEKAATLARESQWSRRAGVAAILGALLAMVGFVVLQATVGGGANFEGLEEAHDSASKIWLAGISSGVGYLLLIGPLYLLFKAAQARSERVRAQLVGVVILGPLLLGLSGFVLAAGTQEAADEYVKGTAESTLTVKEATKECNEESDDKGAKQFAEDYEDPPSPAADCRTQKREEDKASNAIKHASVITVGSFAGLAGGLALVVALFYTGLWSMRTGLLSRFWGSLGMAVGVAALIGLTPLSLLWFLYLGVFLLGVIPNGKPPAWAAGEAIPWPTPGERAAESLAPAEGGLPEGDADIGDADPDAPPDGEPGPSADGPAGPRRKRKQRD